MQNPILIVKNSIISFCSGQLVNTCSLMKQVTFLKSACYFPKDLAYYVESVSPNGKVAQSSVCLKYEFSFSGLPYYWVDGTQFEYDNWADGKRKIYLLDN